MTNTSMFENRNPSLRHNLAIVKAPAFIIKATVEDAKKNPRLINILKKTKFHAFIMKASL